MNNTINSTVMSLIETPTIGNTSIHVKNIPHSMLTACTSNNSATNDPRCPDEISSNQTSTSLASPLNQVVYFPVPFLIGFHTAYTILLLVGILGNILTCYVIVQRKNMRRAIHLYTFNLAVADLLILLVYVPNQMLIMEEQFKWHLGRAICKINYAILPVALHASVGTLLAITIDR